MLDFEAKLNTKNKQNTKRKKRKANELEISSDSQSCVNIGNILLYSAMVGILGLKYVFSSNFQIQMRALMSKKHKLFVKNATND